jgi:dienelactone hydrolase
VAAAPADLFAYDRAAPLEWRDSVEGVVNGLEVHRVSYASPKGGRATGLLYVPLEARPGPDGRFAGMVVLHGAPGDARGMGFASEPVARAGAVVLAVDAPFARRDPQKPLSYTERDSADVVQYIVDLQRAVDVLSARPDVDPERVGALGISYGGSLGALLAGVEHRLRAYVLAVADAGTAAHFTDATGARLPVPAGMTPERWCRWYDSLEPLDATRFIAGATPARLLFLWGRNDWFVRPRLAEALWRAAPEPKEAIWYRSGHMLPGASGDDQLEWLSKHLGLAAPPVFHGRASEYVGTYTGWGGFMDPLELGVVADGEGRLGLRGPFTGPDDPDGRLSYLGPTAEGESFRLDDKRLTFVRVGGRVTQLRIDAPIDDPKAHLVLRHVEAESPDASR